MNAPTITPDTLDFENKLAHWVATGEWPDPPRTDDPQVHQHQKEEVTS